MQALFWEGMAHAAAGRNGRAREVLSPFVRRAPAHRRNRPLLDAAIAFLG